MSLADITPTRRALVVQGGLLAAVAAAGTCCAVQHVAADTSSSLLALGKELDACHAARHAFNLANPYAEDPFYDQHWKLRERINVIPARTYAELSVKARAADYAYEYDTSAECDAAGSFIELSRSLVADVLRLTRSAA